MKVIKKIKRPIVEKSVAKFTFKKSTSVLSESSQKRLNEGRIMDRYRELVKKHFEQERDSSDLKAEIAEDGLSFTIVRSDGVQLHYTPSDGFTTTDVDMGDHFDNIKPELESESLKESTDEILVFKRDVNSAEDVDDIQYAIQKLSDGVAEDALQSAFNEAEGKDIDAVKNAVISALDVYLEDNEWLGEAVDEDKPYSYKEVEQELKSLTNNFTQKSGGLKCGFEEEKEHGKRILMKHYDIVEVSGCGEWYHIEFDNLKKKKAKDGD